MKNNIILISGFVFFLLLGYTIPFINQAFGVSTSTDINAEEYVNELLQNDVSVADIFISMTTVFFWSFNVATWLNLLFLLPLRVIFYVILYDKIKGIGS